MYLLWKFLTVLNFQNITFTNKSKFGLIKFLYLTTLISSFYNKDAIQYSGLTAGTFKKYLSLIIIDAIKNK